MQFTSGMEHAMIAHLTWLHVTVEVALLVHERQPLQQQHHHRQHDSALLGLSLPLSFCQLHSPPLSTLSTEPAP